MLTAIDTLITGNEYGSLTIIHGGGLGTSADSTYRDVFANVSSLTNEIAVGTFVAKKTYQRKSDDTRGDLYAAFYMVKQPEGYFPEGGDYEYARMLYDSSNDYTINPYGLIPTGDNATRGKWVFCAEYYGGAEGSDYLFVE